MTVVSSDNATALAGQVASISRKFTLGDEDLTDLVVSWPTLSRSESKVSPGNVTIRLAAATGQAHRFLMAPGTLITSAALYIGAGGNAADKVYEGAVSGMTVRGGVASIQISDALTPLTLRTVGTKQNPVVFSGSGIYPSDIFWALCTSYGGLSAVQSSSNPHIDYDAYQLWHSEMVADNVFVNAQFPGVRAMEALRKLGRYTDSTIVADPIKITPRRFSSVGSGTVAIAEREIVDLAVDVSARRVINRMDVYGGYDASSQAWGILVTGQSSESTNTYGRRQQTENDAAIWYVNSGSCANLVSRKLSRFSEIYRRFQLTTGMTQIQRRIGDTLYIVDPQNGIDSDFARVSGIELDLSTGQMRMTADVTVQRVGFRLDVSTLDSNAVLL